LEAALSWAAAGYDGKFTAGAVISQVFEFAMERLRAWYLDQGVRLDSFEAVLARHPTQPRDFHRRIQAVTAFRELAEAVSLAAANKRVQNILRKAQDPIPAQVDPALLVEAAERELYRELAEHQEAVRPLLLAGEYSPALKRLAGLRQSVDGFFDQVLVMAEDHRVRGNRLALLQALRDLFLEVADISRLQA
jgi:glycyl-tRNA synthetase beta chain